MGIVSFLLAQNDQLSGVSAHNKRHSICPVSRSSGRQVCLTDLLTEAFQKQYPVKRRKCQEEP